MNGTHDTLRLSTGPLVPALPALRRQVLGLLLVGLCSCHSPPAADGPRDAAPFLRAYEARPARSEFAYSGAVEGTAAFMPPPAPQGLAATEAAKARREEWLGEVRGVLAIPEDVDAALEQARDETWLSEQLAASLPLDAFLRLVWMRDRGLRALRRDLEATRSQFDGAARLDEVSRQYRTYTRELRLRTGGGNQDEPAERLHPWPNVGALRGEWLEADVDVARQRLRSAVADTIAQATESAAQWRYLMRQEEVVAAQLELYARLSPVVEHQVAGGGGSLADLIAVEVEQEALRERLEEVRDLRAESQQHLAVLLELPEDAERARPMPSLALASIDTEGSLDGGAGVHDARVTASKAVWVERARDRRGDLAASRAAVRRMEVARRLAEVTMTPPPASGAALLRGGATGEAGVSKEAPAFRARPALPAWWGLRAAAIEEMREREAAARERERDLDRRLSDDIERALVLFRDAQRDEALYRDKLVGLSGEAFDVAQSAYEGGRARFPDVLTAARRQWDVQLGLARAERDQLRAEAALLRASGVSPRHIDELERRP